MKKWIIAAAMVLASVSAANAGGVRCGIVQVLPGFFLPQCESSERYSYYDRHYYRDHDDRWEHRRGERYDHRHRDYRDGRRHHHDNGRDGYGRHHRPDHRW